MMLLFLPCFPSGAVVLFYRAKFVEPGLHLSPIPLSPSLQPSASHLCIFLYFYYASVSFCLTLIHFHRLLLPPKPSFTHQLCLSSSLQPLSLLHLSPFDQEPVCSFFPRILFFFIPLLLLLFTLLCVCSAITFPSAGQKTMFSPDNDDAPWRLNGYFCASAGVQPTPRVPELTPTLS